MDFKKILQKLQSSALEYGKDKYANIEQKIQKLQSSTLEYGKDKYANFEQNLSDFKDNILEQKNNEIDSIIATNKKENNENFDKKLAHIEQTNLQDIESNISSQNESNIEQNNNSISNKININYQSIKFSNNFTKEQLKMLYQCVALMDKIKDKNSNFCTINIKEFYNQLGFSNFNQNLLFNELNKILSQIFEVDIPNGYYKSYTIFSNIEYRHNEEQIIIKFNSDIMPILLDLKDRFTHINQVKYINQFTSKYAIQFYILLKDYHTSEYIDFEIDTLIKIFALPQSYISSYARLYNKVIKPAIDDINKHSDLWIKEPKITKKQGKKIAAFRLYFGNKSI